VVVHKGKEVKEKQAPDKRKHQSYRSSENRRGRGNIAKKKKKKQGKADSKLRGGTVSRRERYKT